MGRTARGGPTYGAQFWSACTTRQSEDILAMKEDLFGYDRYCIPYKYLPCHRIDLGLNQLVTLPPDYIRRVGTPIKFISYSIQSTKDTGHRVLCRSDSLNLSKSLSLRPCHYPVPITRTSTDHLLLWVYPSVDYRPYFVDSGAPCRGCAC